MLLLRPLLLTAVVPSANRVKALQAGSVGMTRRVFEVSRRALALSSSSSSGGWEACVPRPVCVDMGADYVRVGGFDVAGLLLEPERILFKCAALKQLYAELDGALEVGVGGREVTGPVGSGKSAALWAWCLAHGALGKKVLWCHLVHGTAAGDAVSIVDGVASAKVFGALCEKNFVALGDSLESSIRGTHYDVIVMDAVEQSNVQQVQECLWDRSHRRAEKRSFVIYATSRELNSNKEDRDFDGFKTYYYKPWTHDDFMRAVENDNFYDSVSRVLGGAPNDDILTRQKRIDQKINDAQALLDTWPRGMFAGAKEVHNGQISGRWIFGAHLHAYDDYRVGY